MARYMRILGLLGLLLLVSGLMTACRRSSAPATVAAPGMGVAITGTMCPNIVVDAGQAVLWTNEDEAEHVVRHAPAEGNGQFDSGVLATGDSFSFTFLEAGQFDYACSAGGGMTGSVTVN